MKVPTSVTAHTVGQERCVVAVQYRRLHPLTAFRIPVGRDHVGEIIRRPSDAPCIPVEKPDIVAAVSRHEVVPDMSVPMNYRKIGTRLIMCERSGCGLNDGGNGQAVAITCVSVRSSSRRCHSFVSESKTASKQRGTRPVDA